MQRTALYLLPLFALLFMFLLSHIKETRFNKLFTGILITFVLLNFLSSFNLRSLVDWREEAEIKNVLSYLDRSHPAVFAERSNVTIGTGILFDPSINFYRTINNYNWLNQADYADAGELCDYYLADKAGAAKLKHVKLIRSFSDELFLYKNGLKHDEIILKEEKMDMENFDEMEKDPKGISSDCFFSGKHSAFTDSLWQYSKAFEFVFQDSTSLDKFITVSCNAMLFAGDDNFDGRMVISFEHKDGTLYSWRATDIRDQLHRSNEWTKVIYTRYADAELKKDDKLKVYLWNYGNSPICVDDLNVKVIISK